ncbi:MAG: hypothetical protein GY780_16540 [bacterium]|nr:hypothetical protein [bacterium]
MAKGPENRGRGGQSPRPTQHISTIAHLFFDNDSTVGESAGVSQGDRHIMILGTGHNNFSAYCSAGLGHHLLDQSEKVQGRQGAESDLPDRQVFLAEPAPVCFSALSYLKEETYRPPITEETVPWAMHRLDNQPVLRMFPGNIPSEDFSGGQVGGRFFLSHLDLPGHSDLLSMETQEVNGFPGPLDQNGSTAMVWCVSEETALSFSQASRFGRLVKMVRPHRIHLLIFAGKERKTSSSEERSTGRKPENHTAQAQSLVRTFSDSIEVRSRAVALNSEDRSIVLSSLAREICL